MAYMSFLRSEIGVLLSSNTFVQMTWNQTLLFAFCPKHAHMLCIQKPCIDTCLTSFHNITYVESHFVYYHGHPLTRQVVIMEQTTSIIYQFYHSIAPSFYDMYSKAKFWCTLDHWRYILNLMEKYFVWLLNHRHHIFRTFFFYTINFKLQKRVNTSPFASIG